MSPQMQKTKSRKPQMQKTLTKTNFYKQGTGCREKCNVDEKIIISEWVTIYSSNGRSSFGKATTKYDMQTSCGLLQQNGWKDLLPYILLTYQILKGVGRGSLLTEFRDLYSSVFISTSHRAAPPTHTSSGYSSTNSADNQDIALCHLRQERASSFPRNTTFMSRFKQEE